MKISIVTVAYNSALTIADTLKSVESQTHRDIEYIVVDGASKDETVDIVRTRSTRVSKLVSEPDHGIYDAMNKGASMASGQLIGFLNADDVLECPDSIAVLNEFAERTQADSIHSDLVYVRGNDLSQIVRYWKAGEFRQNRLRLGWMPPHPTFYVQRQQFISLGGFNTKLRIAADYEFMLRFLNRPGVKSSYIDQVMIRMRLGGVSNRSISAIWRKMHEDLEALRENEVGGLFTLFCKNLRKLPQFVGYK